MADKLSILWFRRDLRLLDNAALDWVCANSTAIIPVYIHDDDDSQAENWSTGAASRWWLHHSLKQLNEQLQSAGLGLQLYKGDSEEILAQIIDTYGASSLVFNRLYEPDAITRDKKVTKNFADKIDIKTFENNLFTVPGDILNNQHLPYRVYTPFYKKVRPLLDSQISSYSDQTQKSVVEHLKKLSLVRDNSSSSLEELKLLDDINWHSKLHNYWQPGELSTGKLLEKFIDNAVDSYSESRDFPGIDGTSSLSAHLHFGEITPQHIATALSPILNGDEGAAAMNSAEVYLKQLVWREFAHHVLWHFPHTANRPMNENYKESFWHYDDEEFHRWTRGETGVPIIDAGMKQLWETGWMHNRVRMIVSSFLTKNLGIHWIYGARWFWDTLVDADLANNSMGWQWVAGCGVDAAPYYRVFNPQRQAERFDSRFTYIDRWAPDHIELDYPQPMVDLADSREQALTRYKTKIS